jgi:hypothetical protein
MEPRADIENIIKSKLPDAPLHDIATFIVKYAPDEAKEKIGVEILRMLTFNQIQNERQAQTVIKVLPVFITWNSNFADAIMRELLHRLTIFFPRS